MYITKIDQERNETVNYKGKFHLNVEVSEVKIYIIRISYVETQILF